MRALTYMLEVEERVTPAASRRLVVVYVIWFVRSHDFIDLIPLTRMEDDRYSRSLVSSTVSALPE